MFQTYFQTAILTRWGQQKINSKAKAVTACHYRDLAASQSNLLPQDQYNQRQLAGYFCLYAK